MRIVLVGKTGVGKSSTANTILGQNVFKAGYFAQSVTEECQQSCGNVLNKPVMLIDTPGIFALNANKEKIETEIKRCIHLASPGPHTVLFVTEYGRIRDEDFEAIHTFLKYFGDSLKKFVVFIFTHAERIKDEETLENWLKEAKQLKLFLDQCGGMYCCINNEGTAKEKEEYVRCIMAKITELKTRNGLFYYVDDTTRRAEERVQKMERHIEDSIIREVERRISELERIENENLNKSTCSGDQHEQLVQKIIDWYEKRISEVRGETREELLQAAADEFKDFHFQEDE